VVIVTDPYGRILGFLDRSRYFFYQVAPQLYSRDQIHIPIAHRNCPSSHQFYLLFKHERSEQLYHACGLFVVCMIYSH
jgi:hypothetical protein